MKLRIASKGIASLLALLLLNACGGGGGDGIGILDSTTSNYYYVGGYITGLEGSGVTIQLNGAIELPLTSNNRFNFAAMADSSAYSVSVMVQPTNPNQTCTVANGDGTIIGKNVTNVTVTCMPPSPSELPATFKRVITTNPGVTHSIALTQLVDVSYDIPGLPQWAALNTTSGRLTITPTSVGHQLYDVEMVDANGDSQRYVDALRISVYPASDVLEDYANTLTPEEIINVTSGADTILHTGPQFFHNPDKTSWTACLPYYPGYASNQQIMTVDLSDGTAKVNDTTSVPKDSWHMFKAVPGPGSITYVSAQGGGYEHLHQYDSSTHTFTYNIVDIRPDHRNATQRTKLVAGVNGRIYSFATMEAKSYGDKSVLEFDPDTNTTRFWGDIPSGTDVHPAGDVHGIAADMTHIYLTDNPYGVRTLRSINLATGEINILSAETGYTVYQRKYGVVLSRSSTWWWLYNGEMILASYGQLNESPPWGFDDTDLYKKSTHYLSVAELATKPIAIDESALIPIGDSTTGTLWYKDPTSSEPDAYVSADFPNIVKYTAGIKRVVGMNNGKILGAASGYAGYILYDPVSEQQEHFVPVDGRISNYGTCLDGEDLYVTGYFPGSTFRYNTNQSWDNAMTPAYDPNIDITYLNPKNLGGLGSVGNIGKAYSCSKGGDGLIYIAGENVRSGSGGGMATYNPQTEENLGIKADYESSDVRNVVSIGPYMITSSFAGDHSASIRVAVYDTILGSVVRKIYPTTAGGAIFNNAGRLAADINGEPYVYLYTTTDDNLNTRILKIDILTGDILFDRSYAVASHVGGYNDNGLSGLRMADDGFLYAYMGAYGRWVIRIDPETGDVEPFRVLTNNPSRFDLIGNELYMGGSSLRKISDFKVTYGF